MYYVEPARGVPGQLSSGGKGCSKDEWKDRSPYIGSTAALGDKVPWSYTDDYLQVQDAWARSNGAGIAIGLVDTGIDTYQAQFSRYFAAGKSTGRSQLYMDHTGSTFAGAYRDQCGHGTRMAGVIAAPHDGRNVVGVAWKSNLVSVRHGNTVYVDGFKYDIAAEGIHTAVNKGGIEIIVMAWGSRAWSHYLSDVIDLYYYGGEQVLFLGAAGTSGDSWLLDWAKDDVIFPARKAEVVAVTGLDQNGQIPDDNHYGPEVEIAAFVYQPTTGPVGLGSAGVVSLQGSSNATAAVGGIAALIWSRYPWMTRNQVRKRLHESSHLYPNRSSKIGYGAIRAHKALGGMWHANIRKTTTGGGGYNQVEYFDLEAIPLGGDGPYSYLWYNGATTKVIHRSAAPGDPPYTYSVTITDHSDGTKEYGSTTVYPPPGGCEDPREIICS